MTENDVSSIRMTKGEWQKTRAYATVKFTNGLSVKGIKIIKGPKGLFMAMPSRQTKKNGELAWEDCVLFEDKEDKQLLEKILLKHYESEGSAKPKATSQDDDDTTESFFSDD